MKPEEAIEIIETTKVLYKPKAVQDAFDMAVNAIREVQKYREIGTVKECRDAREKQKPKKCVVDSCPDHTHYKCPLCGQIKLSIYKHGFPRLGRITKYCENCGQAILQENEND